MAISEGFRNLRGIATAFGLAMTCIFEPFSKENCLLTWMNNRSIIFWYEKSADFGKGDMKNEFLFW